MSGERTASVYAPPSIEERTRIDVPLIGTGGSGILPCAVIK
jgi:hypothetical protein